MRKTCKFVSDTKRCSKFVKIKTAKRSVEIQISRLKKNRYGHQNSEAIKKYVYEYDTMESFDN